MKNLHLLMLAALLLGGCTTPRHQTIYRYDPPADPEGQVCLTRCEQALHACYDVCATTYAACVQGLEPEAQARYADALARYESELAHYRHDLERYAVSLSLGWGEYDHWYGAGWYAPNWPYRRLRPYYAEPLPPRPPSYADELGKLKAESCARDCGCQPKYDACFLGCGGSRILEERCFANCPPGDN